MRSLEQGSCLWRNPFNGESFEVSFAKTRFIVFWSKNPAPFMKHIPALQARGLGFYFQFTLNDYEAEGLEPGLPTLVERIATFKRLASQIGPEHVVWRFDPITLSNSLDAHRLCGRIEHLAHELSGSTRKLVISFIDIAKYRSARRMPPCWREPSPEDIEALAKEIGMIGRRYGLEVASCSENVNLELYGIAHNSCVDAALISRLAPDDAELQSYLVGAGKDKGQRKDCLCVKSKDIGQYNTCSHGCLYCYACRSYANSPSFL